MGPATDKHQAPTHRLKLYVRAVIESEAAQKMFAGAKGTEISFTGLPLFCMFYSGTIGRLALLIKVQPSENIV